MPHGVRRKTLVTAKAISQETTKDQKHIGLEVSSDYRDAGYTGIPLAAVYSRACRLTT